MIDPRALQQHFKGIQQRQERKRVPVPRVPDPKPLTAIEAISVPELIIEQEEEIIPSLKREPINLVIDVPPPIGDLIVDEIEAEEPVIEKNPELESEKVLEVKETKEKAEPITENPYGYSTPEDREEDYDPYGYYSGPKF